MSNPVIIKTARNGKKLILDGNIYYRRLSRGAKDYWYCAQTSRCNATCNTTTCRGTLIVNKITKHDHAPDREAAEAELVKARIIQNATEHPEATPAQILRPELPAVRSGVLAHLPDRYFVHF